MENKVGLFNDINLSPRELGFTEFETPGLKTVKAVDVRLFKDYQKYGKNQDACLVIRCEELLTDVQVKAGTVPKVHFLEFTIETLGEEKAMKNLLIKSMNLCNMFMGEDKAANAKRLSETASATPLKDEDESDTLYRALENLTNLIKETILNKTFVIKLVRTGKEGKYYYNIPNYKPFCALTEDSLDYSEADNVPLVKPEEIKSDPMPF
jgi:hypothetical protein